MGARRPTVRPRGVRGIVSLGGSGGGAAEQMCILSDRGQLAFDAGTGCGPPGPRVLNSNQSIRITWISTVCGADGESGDLTDLLTAAGFTGSHRSYPHNLQYSTQQWVDIAFTFSNHLTLAADKATELRTRYG